MKFEIINNKKFIIKINNFYKNINLDNQNKIIKDILLLIKKRYSFNIFGFYDVDIYKINNLASLLIFNKTQDNYFNSIDLKIMNHSNKPVINIEECDIINNLKIDNLKSKDIYKVCEHYSFGMDNLHY